jgi:hypothetical protein
MVVYLGVGFTLFALKVARLESRRAAIIMMNTRLPSIMNVDLDKIGFDALSMKDFASFSYKAFIKLTFIQGLTKISITFSFHACHVALVRQALVNPGSEDKPNTGEARSSDIVN